MNIENNYKNFLLQNSNPRHLKSFELNPNAIHLNLQGRQLINFSSNDYLGLASHPLLLARSHEFAKRWGVGATASRLVSGNLDIFNQLEEQLATTLGKPAALILGSGYQTNTSVLEALLDSCVHGKKPLIFCDKFSHASMIVGARHHGILYRYRHNDLNHLQNILEKNNESDSVKFILAESLYSMDGDRTDLKTLTRIARDYQCILYIDDAHAVGVLGERGWGLASEHTNDVDIIMGTFSKALGCYGGYIACSEIIKKYLINKCRGLIYSTGLSPLILGAISGAIELIPQLQNERQMLLQKASYLRAFLLEEGLDCGKSDSHIVPWIIGDADLALRVSQALEEEGILAVTIRPPTVPLGTSRIRFCLSVGHSDADLDYLFNAIKKVKLNFDLNDQ